MAKTNEPGDKTTKEERTPQETPTTDEEQVGLFLEQARQEVKQIAQREREGEKINRELLNFRMRQVDDP